jgi:hypothetical protein
MSANAIELEYAMEEKDDDKRACLLACVQFTLYAYFSFPISSEKIGKLRNNKSISKLCWYIYFGTYY